MSDPKTNPNENSIATVARDGGNSAVTLADLNKFKAEAMAIAKDAGYNVNQRRNASEETRFAIWEGQSPDGRKHADAQDGKPAFPFEGASDLRIREADMLVNERVLILTAAALRNVPRVKGLELANEPLGAKLTTLLKWVIKNKLGSQYFREIVKLAQYQEGDSPAGAVAGVWWEQETALEMRNVTLKELSDLLLSALGGDLQDPQSITPEIMQKMQEWEAVLHDPALEAEAVEFLQALYPHLKEFRAKLMVKELRENSRTDFPAPYLRLDQPVICAYRLFDDIFFPANTTDAQRCRGWFLREWLTEVQLRERIVSENYAEDFVDEVLKHEGTTQFPEYHRNPGTGELQIKEDTKDDYKGLFEILTPIYKAVNEDNIPGIYYFPYHHAVAMAGHERELLDVKHGKYPFTFFAREILGSRLWDSRGVPELAATDQYAMKLLADSFNDNVSLATLPNIKVPRKRSQLSLVIGPLKIIKEDRPGDVNWMQPPTYPIGNDKQQIEIRRRVDEYFGRISEHVAPMLTQLHQTGMVLNFLANLTDVLTQVLQLCQQYISDEDLQMITDDQNIPIGRSREEIQGKFMVELSFDPRDLDLDYLKTITELIFKVILPGDTLNTIQRDKIINWILSSISPSLAENSVRPVEQANQSEVNDEENNFVKIAAGIEPAMVAEGQNYPLRLQVLMGIAQKNPEALQKLSPTSREIFQARVEHLQNQVQQLKNAQIGRQVGTPALEGN